MGEIIATLKDLKFHSLMEEEENSALFMHWSVNMFMQPKNGYYSPTQGSP